MYCIRPCTVLLRTEIVGMLSLFVVVVVTICCCCRLTSRRVASTLSCSSASASTLRLTSTASSSRSVTPRNRRRHRARATHSTHQTTPLFQDQRLVSRSSWAWTVGAFGRQGVRAWLCLMFAWSFIHILFTNPDLEKSTPLCKQFNQHLLRVQRAGKKNVCFVF